MAASLAGLAALAAISARGCLISIATSPAGPDPCPCRSDRVRPTLKHQIPRPQSAARPLCITGRGRLRPAPGRISPDAELSALSHQPDWLTPACHERCPRATPKGYPPTPHAIFLSPGNRARHALKQRARKRVAKGKSVT